MTWATRRCEPTSAFDCYLGGAAAAEGKLYRSRLLGTCGTLGNLWTSPSFPRVASLESVHVHPLATNLRNVGAGPECKVSAQAAGKTTSYPCEITNLVLIAGDRISDTLWRAKDRTLEYHRY